MRRYFIIFFLSALCSPAQLDPDSLIARLGSAKDDLERAGLCLKIADNHPDESLWPKYNERALALSEKLLESKNEAVNEKAASILAMALNNKAFIAIRDEKQVEAFGFLERAIHLKEQGSDKTGLAACYSNMGALMDKTGKLQKALDYYFLALKLDEETEGGRGRATIVANIANIYIILSRYDKALEYYKEAVELHRKNHNRSEECLTYSNMSSVYKMLGRPDEAFRSAFKSLQMANEDHSATGARNALSKLGNLYAYVKKYDSSFYYSQKSLEMSRQLKDFAEIAVETANQGALYGFTKDFKKAEDFCLRSFFISDSINDLYGKKYTSMSLANLYDSLGKYEQSLRYFKIYSALKDTLFNDENRSALVRQELQTGFDKKEVEMKLEQARKEKEIEKQKLMKNGFIIGSVFLVALIFLVFKNLRNSRRSEQQLAIQKQEVEHKKAIIEEKQGEIISSIHYAQRIQSAVLTSDEVWKRISKDYFILFMPRDIVSGDFYWAYNTLNNRSVFALADSTGHGVPGGFMSMLGNSFLNEIVVENKIFNPATILNKLRQKVIRALDQKGDEQRKDGMDIAICVWNKINNSLEFAGANNSVMIVRGNKITEIKADKMPIGNYVGNEKEFTSQTIQLQPGDCVYMATDGYTDQFGGPAGKKLKYKKMEALLLSVCGLPMPEQKIILEKAFKEWQGTLEQVDDVSVIGLRV
jgi:serine phosphatase RsbU (regulator of sigma subunit)